MEREDISGVSIRARMFLRKATSLLPRRGYCGEEMLSPEVDGEARQVFELAKVIKGTFRPLEVEVGVVRVDVWL